MLAAGLRANLALYLYFRHRLLKAATEVNSAIRGVNADSEQLNDHLGDTW